jgi:hypothetical protein
LDTANSGGALTCTSGLSAACGRARVESFVNAYNFGRNCVNFSSGNPFSSFVPSTPPPSLRVVGIAGQSVPPDPTGNFDAADVTINTGEPVEVTIEGRYVPLGTVPKLYLFSQEGNDQSLDAPPLEGTVEQSTSTVLVTFPPLVTRGYVRASWEVGD